MEKIHENMCFDVVFLYENIGTGLFTCFPVFSPFSAPFYPPLHHNGKGSIIPKCMTIQCEHHSSYLSAIFSLRHTSKSTHSDKKKTFPFYGFVWVVT